MTKSHWLMTLLTALLGVGVFFLAWKFGITEKEILAGLIIGLASGLTTASTILILRYIIRGGINPWIENLLYRDAHIEGTWIGALVPYYGVEELDRRVKEAAMHAIFQSMKRQKKKTQQEKSTPVEASVIENGKEKKIDAELILPESKHDKENDKKPFSIRIDISPTPIRIRLDLNRVGHRISGKITELGGASDIHTYQLEGNFKNLIAAGCYDNDNKSSLDRGSFSLV